ncbi:hypothetical protein [Thiorhodococcus fuscus]|uniref:DUF4276 family protein n=1 Tax=Thiorhodococcus fuscus TaxID=527200 RepID=A0ABW4Y7D5_9GAMM
MNIYFLVEGKTERIVYPKWLAYFLPELSRVDSPRDAVENNYYLISGGGFPGILTDHLVNAVDDFNECGSYDYLALVIDGDDLSFQEKTDEVRSFVKDEGLVIGDDSLKIFPQIVCMETWFLGNKRIYSRNPSDKDVALLSRHYDVSVYDPEIMPKPNDYVGTLARFHYSYLKAMFRDKNISYSKSRPGAVCEPSYVRHLVNRLESEPSCLQSMRHLLGFFELCKSFGALQVEA